MNEERFYAIRLTDGELIYGEFKWMTCDGPDDWTVTEESEHDTPTEYEIVEMIVHPVAKRTFGEEFDYGDDTSTADEVDEAQP